MEFIDKDIYKNESGIYRIRNLITGKIYIGQTTMHFIKRYWHHQWKLSNCSHDNKHLQAAQLKYGEENFVFEVLHVLKDGEDINKLEIEYIQFFDSDDGKHGYNIQHGGQEKKLVEYVSSEAHKLVGAKNREHLLGRKLPEETKKYMKESAHRGEDNCSSKLSVSDVIEIKKMLQDGISANSIGKKFNVSKQNILSIKHNKTWAHVTI